MKYMYFLEHIRYYSDNNFSDQKNLWVYSSIKKLNEEKKIFLTKEWFIKHKDWFITHKVKINNKFDFQEPINRVFVLQHWIPYDDDYHEKNEFIWIFDSELSIDQLITSLKNNAQYKLYPDNFYVSNFTLDISNPIWKDWFIDD